MVKAIDFAVRTSAGNVVNGAVSGDGGSQFLQVGSGETVSLNLSQSSVLGYERQGSDLVLKLADGREITLSGYFEANPGEDNKLYLSSNGDVTEVFLTDAGNGQMYANYGPVDTWNKYSNVDDIRFVDENNLVAGGYSDDTVGMGAFAPGLLGGGGGGLGLAAAGLGGLGLLGALGGGGGGGGDTPISVPPGGGGGAPAIPVRIPPVVNDPATSKDISTVTPDKAVEVTGTGQPGETVVVTVGTKTQTTTITEDGKWETKFEGPNFPGDGTHEAVVTVTPNTGGPAEVLDGPGFVIDLTPPPVSTTAGTVSAGDVENLTEYADGVTVKGEGEPGASILVTVAGGSQPTTVGTDGTWEVTFTQTQIPGGEFKEIPVTITATDGMGNVTTITDSIAIDTVPHTLGFNTVAGDNVVSKLESDGTVTVSGTISGTSSNDATVSITLDGVSGSKTAAVVNGTWTTTYPAGTFSGNNERTFTATTIDAAGNATTAVTKTIIVDTTASVNFTAGNLPGDVNGSNSLGDGKLNATETNNGVTMTGKAEIGSQSVTVVWNGYTKTLTAGDIDSNGNWSVNFAKSEMPFQPTNTAITSTATVTAIDQYGNQSATDSKTVVIDTKTSVSFDPNQSGGDNIISSSEAGNGVKLTGTAESGASVEVTYRGTTHTVTAGTDGKWEAPFTTAELKVGGMQNGVWVDGVTDMTNGSATLVQVRATDGAGNVVSTTGNVQIDTQASVTAQTTTYGTDKVLNNAESVSGLVVTGTAEAGSKVTLTFGNYTNTFDVVGTTWTHTIPQSSLPGGNAYGTANGGAVETKLVVTATDQYGNVSAPYSEDIDIDRIVTPFTNSGPIGGNGIVDATEAANGLVLTGSGELGAEVKVVVTNNGGTPFSFTSDSVSVGPNGTWTIRLDANQLPDVDNQKFNFTLQAKDKAGNVSDIVLDNVTVDTVAPDSANITNFGKNIAGTLLSDVTLDEAITTDYSFHRIGADGTQYDISLKPALAGSQRADFANNLVPEGDYLVINHEDAAGNGSATLFLTNNTGTSTVDLNNAAFKEFDFTQLDLSVAKTTLSISAEQLIAMTGPDNTLIIKGGGDDTVTMLDAEKAGDQTGSPAGFTLYTLGDGAASVYLDDDIQRPNF